MNSDISPLKKTIKVVSFRNQIVFTFVFGFVILISIFSIYMAKVERDYLYNSNKEDTINIAHSLSLSTRSWVLANDVVGLQEVVSAMKSHSALNYAMIISNYGRVLAHTDKNKSGLFVSDKISLELLKSTPKIKIILEEANVIDVAVPIMLGERQIGWVRVSMSRNRENSNLDIIIWRNIVFILLASTLALFASLFIAKRLSYGINSLIKVTEQVKAGNLTARINCESKVSEIVTLSNSFNHMLESLMQAHAELKLYKDNLEDEVKQRTADLILARDEADAANKSKSIFLANMSHELRTPLNAILGFSDLLKRDSTISEKQQETLNIIHKSGNHLLGLINDILDIAKIESGRISLDLKTFDLGNMILDVTNMFSIKAQEKGIDLILDQSSTFPRYIVGDEGKLRQIIINLLSNAIKATENGTVILRLYVKHNKLEHLIIEVEDTGCGISEEDQSKLFKPFVQVGAQNKQQGTGLGLAITRKFTNLMGGDISIKSSLGKGSIFTAEVVIEIANAKDIPYLLLENREIISLEEGQPSYRILVVEDQEDNQILLTRLLESVGFDVKLAVNGKEAIESFIEWKPHFIWMDRRMPVMDGIEATKQIRLLPSGKDVKIVAITASSFKEEDQEIASIGFDDIVHKPYRANNIFNCMEKILGVRFVNKECSENKQEENIIVTLSKEDFTNLSIDLRNKFINSLISLDISNINDSILNISQSNSILGKKLMKYAEEFKYNDILNILKASS